MNIYTYTYTLYLTSIIITTVVILILTLSLREARHLPILSLITNSHSSRIKGTLCDE